MLDTNQCSPKAARNGWEHLFIQCCRILEIQRKEVNNGKIYWQRHWWALWPSLVYLWRLLFPSSKREHFSFLLISIRALNAYLNFDLTVFFMHCDYYYYAYSLFFPSTWRNLDMDFKAAISGWVWHVAECHTYIGNFEQNQALCKYDVAFEINLSIGWVLNRQKFSFRAASVSQSESL